MIDSDTRLRVGRAIGKEEEGVAEEIMFRLLARGHPDTPPPLATDGEGGYREAMIEVWGKVPEYSGRGRPPTRKQAQADWQYLKVVKVRSNGRVRGVIIKVVYGEPQKVFELLGGHLSYVERTHLTSRQMNGRVVRKTLSFSKKVEMLKASCVWEDWVYNLTRPLKTLREEVNDGQRRWKPITPGMAAGLTDHIWTIKELLTTVVAPNIINTK